MKKILNLLLIFRKKRDWKQFHTPQNIAQSIVLEAAELLEIFQWRKDEKVTTAEKKRIAEELADIYNWILLLAHDLDIDIEQAAQEKIIQNEKKYPIDKAKGNAKKYTEL